MLQNPSLENPQALGSADLFVCTQHLRANLGLFTASKTTSHLLFLSNVLFTCTWQISLAARAQLCDCFSSCNSPPELGATCGLWGTRKNNCSALCWGYRITGATTRCFIMIIENKGQVNRADVSPALSMTWWCSACSQGDSALGSGSPFAAYPAHPALCRLAVWVLFFQWGLILLWGITWCDCRSLDSITPPFPPAPSCDAGGKISRIIRLLFNPVSPPKPEHSWNFPSMQLLP